ncbi:hypothetical protein KC678_00055 [Candidatus Dojkabacteria bacterium]|uniref:histidine kinase n=1 Tax=Candidatus Dojkabacteria bacterium TaxID=2099670 RepID=A0A955L072_9BACT|nr:hypothetical protein [Candidatus Dojkabacteria bacterium]
MTLANVIYIIILLVSFFTATYVLLASKKVVSIIFVLLTYTLGFWVFTNFLLDNIQDNNLGLIIIRLSVLGPILIGPLFFNFAMLFPSIQQGYKHKYIYLTLLSTIFFIPFIPTKYNISYINITEEEGVDFGLGQMYWIFIIYLCVFVLLAIYFLIKKYRKSIGIEKLQLSLFGISFFTTFILAIVFALLIPQLGYPELGVIGPLSSVIFIGVTAYTLIRHGLFDIRLILGKITYFTLSAFILYISFYIFVSLDIFVFNGIYSPESLFIGIFFAYLFVLIYDNYNEFIKEKVESSIINPGYNPNEVIRQLNHSINTQLEYIPNIESIISAISQTIRPLSKWIIVSKGTEIERFGPKEIELKKDQINHLFELFQSIETDTFVKDEYLNEASRNISPIKNVINEILGMIENLDISVILGIKNQNAETIALLILGHKDGYVPYSLTEVRFLRTLADMLSVSLTRSFLFEEVKQFNATLQKKVDDATAELAQRNDQLGEQLRKERDMMDILGHELRTPLGTARNALVMIDSLQKKGAIDEKKFDKYFTISLRNIRREKDLLETILQSARLENSRIQINLEKVAVQDVIDDSMTAFQEQAEQKGLELTAKVEVPNAYINVDRTAIQQIMDNLVSNAVKYTYKGYVHVTVTEEEGGFIRFKVEDTGEGISEEDLKNIGKKFFRANTHLDSAGKIGDRKIVRPGGTGIGVYVIMGLLKEFGSKLEIQSEFGKGSTFSFKLKKLDMNQLSKKIEIKRETVAPDILKQKEAERKAQQDKKMEEIRANVQKNKEQTSEDPKPVVAKPEVTPQNQPALAEVPAPAPEQVEAQNASELQKIENKEASSPVVSETAPQNPAPTEQQAEMAPTQATPVATPEQQVGEEKKSGLNTTL